MTGSLYFAGRRAISLQSKGITSGSTPEVAERRPPSFRPPEARGVFAVRRGFWRPGRLARRSDRASSPGSPSPRETCALRARTRNVAWKASSASYELRSTLRQTESTMGPCRVTRASKADSSLWSANRSRSCASVQPTIVPWSISRPSRQVGWGSRPLRHGFPFRVRGSHECPLLYKEGVTWVDRIQFFSTRAKKEKQGVIKSSATNPPAWPGVALLRRIYCDLALKASPHPKGA